MKNILTEALVNSATNASFIFSYTNSAKLRFIGKTPYIELLYHILQRHTTSIQQNKKKI